MSGSRKVFATQRNERFHIPGHAFPVALGGPEGRVAARVGSAPSAHLGYSEGDLYVQPCPGGLPVLCNGTVLSASRWLEHGDRLSVANVEIEVKVAPESVELRVRVAEDENLTEPPRIVSPVAPGAGAAGDAPIHPVAFRPKAIASRPRRELRLRRATLAGWGVLAALLALGWFVLTSRSVGVQIEPAPERVSFRGGVELRLGERFLIRPGRYTLVAERAGYRPLEAEVEITREPRQELRFDLRPLPGRLSVDAGGVIAAVLVEGVPVGTAPLEGLEVEPGERELRVEAERYRPHAETVRIEGAGVEQRVSVSLEPLWAEVSLSSTPPGAAVRVDGVKLGETPLTAELLSGERELQLSLAGYKPHAQRLQVVASQPQLVPIIELRPSDGNLVVTSEPSGAALRVGDRYRGETPLDIFLAPGSEHTLSLAKAGYSSETVLVSVRSGESRSVEVTLEPRLGEIEVAARPVDAELLVDGVSRGPASQSLRLLATSHEIEIRKPGFETYRASVAVKADFPQRVEVELRSLEAPPARLAVEIRSAEGHVLRLMPVGSFRMGASRREPGRRANETLRDVELVRPFYLSTAEVTNRQFRRFRTEHLSGRIGAASLETDHHPVVQVSWHDAAAYCNWLSERESLPAAYAARDGKLAPVSPPTTGYRLPTEAEWEWAARYAGRAAPSKYAWGDSLPVPPGSGNYADSSAYGVLPGVLDGYDDGYPGTSPAESFVANAVGLFGLGGNVAEWVQDLYAIHPAGAALERDPLGPEEEGEHRVIRGASYLHSTVTELRLSFRDYGLAPRPDVGFRIARYAE